jgi:hypothetical protein
MYFLTVVCDYLAALLVELVFSFRHVVFIMCVASLLVVCCALSGAAVVPRSSKSTHLQENLRVTHDDFSLTDSEMKSLGWPHVTKSDEL